MVFETTPQLTNVDRSVTEKKDDIVISGLSCRFPGVANMRQFGHHLLAAGDVRGLYSRPQCDHVDTELIRKFDASYLDLHPSQVDNVAARTYIMHEVVFEAICDAGYNKSELMGKPIAVIVVDHTAATKEDMGHISACDAEGQKPTLAHKLSTFFSLRGPSFSIKEGPSSSLLAFQLANQAITMGDCFGAIIAELSATQMLESEHAALPLKEHTNDVGTSMAIFLQTCNGARRAYATVLGATSGFTSDSQLNAQQMLRGVWNESAINPIDVTYIEYSVSCKARAATSELIDALKDVFSLSLRDRALLVALSSDSESVLGLALVGKAIVAMQSGFVTPSMSAAEISDFGLGENENSLRHVSEKHAWSGGVVGVGSFTCDSWAHVVLRPWTCSTRRERNEQTPRLFLASGRTMAAAETMLNAALEYATDCSFYRLAAPLSQTSICDHPIRGYVIQNATSVSIKQRLFVEKVPARKRPLVFFYDGFGTQWPGMALDLMSIEPFRTSIQRSSDVLRPFNIDLFAEISAGCPNVTTCAITAGVGIVAVQIAQSDLLRHIGLEPDYIFGVSLGEIAASYVDDCLTREQAMLCAYWYLRCVLDANLPPGALAAFAMPAEEAEKLCPAGVTIIVKSFGSLVTLSGHAEPLMQFLKEMETKGVFAREMRSCGVPFHSPLMRIAQASLTAAYENVIPYPKRRSSRWISTSVPDEHASSYDAQFCSAAYHVNNIMSEVLFDQAMAKVPDDAAIIEISPTCRLQMGWQKLKSSCKTFGLAWVQLEPGVDRLERALAQLGKLYTAGVDVHIERLYRAASLPVPLNTPMISPLIQWDHAAPSANAGRLV